MLTPTKIRSTTPTIDVYVKLAQYPILCDQIRMQMREELFRRGIVSATDFEMEVKQLALESQRREGLNDPYSQEDNATWQRRIAIIRDLHTDNYFGNNLGARLLEQLIEKTLKNQDSLSQDPELRFNPEIAPWAILFRQGAYYEMLPPPQRALIHHHLEELKVVLIKRLISDNLQFIGIAKHIFTVEDLSWIYDRLVGSGKIGGKAAGILLALTTLNQKGDKVGPDISQLVAIPETFFIGSEIIYEFIYINSLERYVNQKYLPEDEIRAQFPNIIHAFMEGDFPPHFIDQLQEIVRRLNQLPYVVRSSSLLEDNFSFSFAGMYESHICFRPGDDKENLKELSDAIRRVYASTFNPDAMKVRQQHGLVDYDERMAIMVQPLIGQKHGRFFWPTISGIAISCNPTQISQNAQVEDGILRLVWGYDERTRDPFSGEDGALIVPLDKPSEPINGETAVNLSPQTSIKVIDLKARQFRRLPVGAVLQSDCPHLEYISIAHPDKKAAEPERMLTFDFFTRDPKFIKLMRTALMRLETVYEMPVIFEFVVDLTPDSSGVDYKLYILQCRPYLEA